MNRQEKRQLERQGQKVPIVQKLTQEQLDGAIAKIKFDATLGAVKVITAVMAISLADEYSFGAIRIQKLIERMRSQLECIESDTVNIDDIYKWCVDKGIKLF